MTENNDMFLSSQKALALLGPTASGKSEVAIKLAKQFNGEVISCDSRQIYRGMDIGSGKVARDLATHRPVQTLRQAQDRLHGHIRTSNTFYSDGVRHHMIDIISPRTEYNVAKFQKKANRIIEDILKRKKLPILCGGTGFWAQALVEDMIFPGVLPDKKLREKFQKKSALQLYKQLQKLNPDRAKTLGPHNKVYLIRAIEVALVESSKQKAEREIKKKSYTHYSLQPTHWLVMAINVDRERLYEKIEKRLDERLGEGMIDEIYNLHFDKEVPWTRLDAFGLEYRWVSKYLQKQISYNDMRDNLLTDIRHYAKRQLTYLRRWERQGRKVHQVKDFKEASRFTKDFLKLS